MQSLSIATLTLIHLTGYALVLWALGSSLAWDGLIFAGLLIWASVIDADRFEIPDVSSFLLVMSGLVFLIAQDGADFVDSILGAFLWPLMFWGIAYGYLKTRGFHGLGFGDVKLMCGIGIWCGFVATIHVVLTASVAGIIVLALQAIRRSDQNLNQSKVAFGPFLCLSAWAIWLAGAQA